MTSLCSNIMPLPGTLSLTYPFEEMDRFRWSIGFVTPVRDLLEHVMHIGYLLRINVPHSGQGFWSAFALHLGQLRCLDDGANVLPHVLHILWFKI